MDARQRNAEAQRRYRKHNAKRLTAARKVRNILARQKTYVGDIEALAKVLRACLTDDGIKELRRALGRRG
jgi:hypothetical protein